ncbi:MAG TPA: NAD-dependent succinate-semialdehyde dehydrogenase [Solirubrobacteraceae bacterium]|jgi:succinate-semialdehyde dehydrogenase/glutarate-semialdehyde dehydrogenase|nr:NAD-dependent succinate-semialdehyde dehydrogenase [Solirubrobacteraceae bacterium]
MTALEHEVLATVPKDLLIGGEWRQASTGASFPVEDPATGETLCEVADAGVEDALAALAAADEAKRAWRAEPARARGELLRRAFALIVERADELALLMTLEMGKPVHESRAEIAYGAEFLRWYAEEAVRISGRFQENPSGPGRILTMREPVGPCLFITPWNFPLAMGTRKIGPALAAGCTVIVKPASQTPLSMLALGQIFVEVGVPAGVVNIVCTKRSAAVMEPLLRDPRLRKLSFTGSTETGRALIERSAHQILRVSMELGGNAPFLVFEDADLEAAVAGAVVAKMRNGGEACVAANRFLVAEGVAERFSAMLAERMSRLVVGRGTDPGVEVGPLIDDVQRTKVHELVTDAVERGASVLRAEEPPAGPGYFYAPTVVTAVPPGARLLEEEIFGPVAPVTSFASEEEAIAEANRTEYGLAAYVYTRDLGRAFRVIGELETGMVGLNQGMVSNAAAPFGGVKHSGFGREGGPEGIEEYLETKYVAMTLP